MAWYTVVEKCVWKIYLIGWGGKNGFCGDVHTGWVGLVKQTNERWDRHRERSGATSDDLSHNPRQEQSARGQLADGVLR